MHIVGDVLAFGGDHRTDLSQVRGLEMTQDRHNPAPPLNTVQPMQEHFPHFLSKFLTELCADVQSWLARCHGGCTAINLDFMGREKPLEEPSFEPFSL